MRKLSKIDDDEDAGGADPDGLAKRALSQINDRLESQAV